MNSIRKRYSTFIKWNGNKSHYLKTILPIIPINIQGRYIEPFLGSGAVFLALVPPRFLISDINSNLIRLWCLIRDRPEYVFSKIRIFKKLFFPMTNRERVEYGRSLCSRFNKLKEWSDDMICKWWMISMSAFMGTIIRKNTYYFDGLDLKIVKHDRHSLFSERFRENLKDIHHYLNLSHGEILCDDYQKILRKARPGDFIFLDPPYARMEQGRNDIEYNIDSIEPCVLDLYRECMELDKKGIQWMMTQSDCAIIRRVFNNYRIVELSRYSHRTLTKQKDLIIMNY